MKNKRFSFLGKKKAQSGFTLIELIIVIAIVVVISAVTISSLTRSQDQQIFSNSFEKLYSLLNTARSLSISGKGQLDFTDFDNDGCKDTITVPCPSLDYVTPANYGLKFDVAVSPNVIMFADINPPTSGTINGQKGVYNPGTSYATGEDLDLDSMNLPAGVTMEMAGLGVSPTSGSIFFSPNYADITFNPSATMNAEPYLLIRLKQGTNVCKQIRIHKLAGIPEVESCLVAY